MDFMRQGNKLRRIWTSDQNRTKADNTGPAHGDWACRGTRESKAPMQQHGPNGLLVPVHCVGAAMGVSWVWQTRRWRFAWITGAVLDGKGQSSAGLQRNVQCWGVECCVYAKCGGRPRVCVPAWPSNDATQRQFVREEC